MFIILVQIHLQAVCENYELWTLKLSIVNVWSRTRDGEKISTVEYAGITDLTEQNE